MASQSERPRLRRGDEIELGVEKGVYRGLGLARHEGQVVFVPRGLPGDRLRVRVESVSRGYAVASAVRVLEGAASRRPSPCPYFSTCGGCAYQELEYANQLRLKEAILRESLARAGAPWEGEIPVQGCAEEGWRSRASFHLEARGDVLRMGFYQAGTRKVTDIEHCLHVSPALNRAARGLLSGLQRRPHLGRRVRAVELAESLDGRELAACLEADLSPKEAVALASLAESVPGVTGLGVLPRDRRFLNLRGEPYVHANVLGMRLRSHVRSFFQVNRFLVEDLARAVVELTPPGGTVLDLYAGVGLFALPLAQRADQALAVELNRTAADDAEENARRAGLGNLRVRCGDARDALAARPPGEAERIVLDPPRAGAGPETVRAVAARRPWSVVYVSCDPPTLGRDLRIFADEGYAADSVRAFDLFPDTFHLETLVRLGAR